MQNSLLASLCIAAGLCGLAHGQVYAPQYDRPQEPRYGNPLQYQYSYGSYQGGYRGWPTTRYGPAQHMDPREAQEIANYWIESYLRRAATPEEVQAWGDELLRSRPADVLSNLLASREYYEYAGATQRGFIRQLIADVGHREPSRYEIEGVLQSTAGLSPEDIAHDFLRRYPRNWWPGPAATPPRELQHLYGYGWR